MFNIKVYCISWGSENAFVHIAAKCCRCKEKTILPYNFEIRKKSISSKYDPKVYFSCSTNLCVPHLLLVHDGQP